jgi:membrane fusion protein (multidrug efflux system)
MANTLNRGFSILSRLRSPFLTRLFLLSLGPVVLLVIGAYYYAIGGRYISTENAYVKADKIAISTDVSGRVANIHVIENQYVAKDQLLFSLDKSILLITRQGISAEISIIRSDITTLQKLYAEKLVDLKSGEESAAFFKREFNRRVALMKRGVVTQDRFDAAGSNMERARSRADGIRQELGDMLSKLGGDPKIEVKSHPRILEAKARLERVELHLKDTEIRAPVSGYITKHDLQVGEYVVAGKPVFSVVGGEKIWVEANLKETELTYIRIRQSAEITVDAYPDMIWTGEVASISPATGAEFSILPPQNATGNWVKVVQRIPVRLAVTQPPNQPKLRAGMSVVVKIDTKHQRVLPDFAAKTLSIFRD